MEERYIITKENATFTEAYEAEKESARVYHRSREAVCINNNYLFIWKDTREAVPTHKETEREWTITHKEPDYIKDRERGICKNCNKEIYLQGSNVWYHVHNTNERCVSNRTKTSPKAEPKATVPEYIWDDPTPIQKGDKRILINGKPPKVPCRIIAEDLYQAMLKGVCFVRGDRNEKI